MSITGAFIVPHPPIILPQVGRGEEEKIKKTIDAYRKVAGRIAALQPEVIILTSPHATLYADYFHISPGKGARGDLRRFGASGFSMEVEYDTELVRAISEEAGREGIHAGTMGEREKALDHGTLVPLYFINQAYADYKLIRIGLSGLTPLEHYRFGRLIARVVENLGRRAVFVASGDLSHKLLQDGPYGFVPEGPEFDGKVTEAMEKADFLAFLSFDQSFCDSAAECGLRSFIIMAGALDGKSVKPELLSYEGTFGVGYGIASYEVAGEDPGRRFDEIFIQKEQERLGRIKAKEDAYVQLARLSLETFVKTGEMARLPDDLPDEMLTRRAGVFVSLKKHGHLRGCIGTISPVTDNIAQEILRNAINAGTEDPRFPEVTRAELQELVYSVDVLSEPEPIQSMDELDVKRYGVIVTSGHRRGLLLPNLETIDTPRQQVEIALEKAGIRPGQPYSMERFEVVRHK